MTLTRILVSCRFLGALAVGLAGAPHRIISTVGEGVTRENGTELTAEHVAAVSGWFADPENGSSHPGGRFENFTVEADNEARTVTLTLDEPRGFLGNDAGTVPIVCADGMENPESIAYETDGTRAFVLTEHVADDQVTLTVREGYSSGPGGASTSEPEFPAEVVLRVMRDPSTIINSVLNDAGGSRIHRAACHFASLATPAGTARTGGSL